MKRCQDGENTQSRMKELGRWQVVQFSRTDVNCGQKISRQVASKQHRQQNNPDYSPLTAAANSVFGLCRGLMEGGDVFFFFFL